MPPKLYPRLLLAVLTGLNILNYIDRNVLFAVQSDVKKEFLVSDAKIGILTSAFFFTYMFAAPVVGWMGDRFPRKNIVVFGIFIWSGFTFFTWLVHDYNQLLFRHAIVGIGEASYATIAPTLIADSFPPLKRGRMLSIFFLGLPVGSAARIFCRRLPGAVLWQLARAVYGRRNPRLSAGAPALDAARASARTARGARSGRCADFVERFAPQWRVSHRHFWHGCLHLCHGRHAGLDSHIPRPPARS